MASIATIILNSDASYDDWTMTDDDAARDALTFDPTVGTGSMLDSMDAPEDFTAAFFAFDPFVA